MITIAPAQGADDLMAVDALFRAYARSLDIDLGYQDFAGELAALPGAYAPPHGALLLARREAGEPIGCVALRPMAIAGGCEMKRLYMVPEARGLGLGRALMLALIAEACRIGYTAMWLDTLPTMAAAQALYRGAGFAAASPYYATPVPGTLFMRLSLDEPANSVE